MGIDRVTCHRLSQHKGFPLEGCDKALDTRNASAQSIGVIHI